MKVSLHLTQAQFQLLAEHLLPGDGCEAVAIALCGHGAGSREHKLLVREIVTIPHDACLRRERDFVKWPSQFLVPYLEKANKSGYSIAKFHSHPSGLKSFSKADDRSDSDLMSSLPGWIDADVPHASVILTSDHSLIGRWTLDGRDFADLDHIVVVGDNIQYHSPFSPVSPSSDAPHEEFRRKNASAFGQRTVSLLGRMSVAVVGCSGTGSLVIEQLARLGVGRLVLVDPDKVEEKNLNRILHATATDARNRRPKVSVLADAIDQIGLGTDVEPYAAYVSDRDAALAVSSCDVLFGCTDGAESRSILNRLATFYLMPYFDVGVRLDADHEGTIDQVSCGIHYLQPGRSTLLSRGVISTDRVHAEGMRRTAPERYAEQRRQAYISGVDEDRPAVISVNMVAASLVVNEFLARLHDYRTDGNSGFAEVRLSLSHGALYAFSESAPCPSLVNHVGRGDVTPFLDSPGLGA